MQSLEHKLFLERVNTHITFANELAARFCKKYFSSKVGFSKCDIKSEALLGLCIAVKSFKGEDEVSFKAYCAAIIANRIKRYLTNASTPVSLKYSTSCDYKKSEVSAEKSKAARMLQYVTERKAYSEESYEQSILVDDYYRKESDSEKYVEFVMESRRLREAIDGLSSETKEIIKSVYYDDLSAYEVAKTMNCSAVTVYKKQQKAFVDLSRMLGDGVSPC